MHDVEYYLSKGFDQRMAEYYAAGKRVIESVKPQKDFSLLLTFDNGETRIFNCGDFVKEGTVFAPLKAWENFSRAYLDEQHAVSWDLDPDVDSNVHWENKVDLSPDVCYVDSVPV